MEARRHGSKEVRKDEQIESQMVTGTDDMKRGCQAACSSSLSLSLPELVDLLEMQIDPILGFQHKLS